MKTIKKLETLNVNDDKKQKVAAYARVSHRDLLQSLSEQISYYSKLIQNVNVNIKMYKSDKIKMYNYSKLT